ncbi:MAG: PASTA domain-containing protein [Oscillospiraceae bacterium]|jgi:stage V sporulation protein D (sporulation-specific penicillin-binding protein)|nr:PASTA domain-containing protein [Oscillospiraceae bacterium]
MAEEMSHARRANRTVLFRTILLMSLFGVALFVPLFVKLYSIQIIKHDLYEKQAVEQQTRDDIISPVRGTIYDRNYKPLAVSASVETVFLEPVSIVDDAQAMLIARNLSEILGVDYDETYAKAKKADRYYEEVKKNLEKPEADLVRAFIAEHDLQKAVRITPAYKRYYPDGNFAAHIIGFTNSDGDGVEGVERVYNTDLKGTAGRIITAKDAKGITMPFQYEKYYDAQNGLNLVLTIDETLQGFLENHLKTAVVENEVKERAAGIIMDVKTGEILAMDTQNGYDPNTPRTLTDPEMQALIDSLSGDEQTEAFKSALYAQWRNKIVADTYEPGSTFKIITTAVALEEKAVKLDDQFYCHGSITIPGWGKPINCARRAGHGAETFVQGVQNSCNPVFVEVAERVGPETFYNYFQAFGFTQKTGIDIPGESGSVYHTRKDFNTVALAAYAFGQTFNITPIQLITAVSAVANGGNLMKPHLVKGFTDSEGNLVKTVEPETVRQVISAETSKQVCEILESVVSVGGGKNAYVAGYRIGGKTGTSQKRDPDTHEYMVGRYVTSFVGFAPADDPQVAVLVLLDEPMYGPANLRTGGGMAAPVVGRILSDVLPYLQIEPQYTSEELAGIQITVPTLSGLSVSDAEQMLKNQNIQYRVIGEGEMVTQQMPAPGARVPGTAEVILYVGGDISIQMTQAPDVNGKTAEQANELLTNAGLYMHARGATAAGGSGVVAYRQDIPTGTEVPVGTVVEVEFRDLNTSDAGTWG